MYSIRTRSGSVGPRETSSSSYRTTFTGRTEKPSTSRFSRASSCDPSARSSSRPPPNMSHSYHNDYSSRSTGTAVSSSYSTRYGSMGSLSSMSSSTYRSPYSSSNYRNDITSRRPDSTSYRNTDTSSSYRTPSTYRASSTFTPRFESRLPPRDFSSSSLSKYRPESTTSYSRSNFTNSTSSYNPRARVDFRSKTPTSSEVSTRQSRFDREYKSMTRFEKTPVRENKCDDEVENTFQRLYNRYVKDLDLESSGKKEISSLPEKNFVSHSEAEIDDESASESENSFAETLKRRREESVQNESNTPKGPSPSLVTPTTSPLPQKKIIEELEKVAQTVEEFKQKHFDVEMKPAVIEARVLKPAGSAMANLLKMDGLAAKMADAIHKKKTAETEVKPSVNPIKSLTAAKSSSLTTKPESKPPHSPEKPTKGGFFNKLFSSKSANPAPSSQKQPSLSSPAPIPSNVNPSTVSSNSSEEKASCTVKSPNPGPLPVLPGSIPKAPGVSLPSTSVKPFSPVHNSSIIPSTVPSKTETSTTTITSMNKVLEPLQSKSLSPGLSNRLSSTVKEAIPTLNGQKLSLDPSLPSISKILDPSENSKSVSQELFHKAASLTKKAASEVEAQQALSTVPPSSTPTTLESSFDSKSTSSELSNGTVKDTQDEKVSVPKQIEKSAADKLVINLTVPTISGSGKIIPRIATSEPKKDTLPLPGTKARSSSPRAKPSLTIDTKKAEEASTSVTILMPKGDEMSRSVSPGAISEEKNLPTGGKKSRDKTRTLENMLKEVAEKRDKDDKSSTGSPITPSSSRPPPLLLVTGASVPSTPKVPKAQESWGSGSGSYYGSDEDMNDEEGWTEAEDEEDYDSDFEFCISETFRIPAKTNVNVYPPSIRGSPFVSDYESDCSAPFLASQKWEDSRGRVDRLFAVPPPTFTCSVSYDGQESWDSESVHSCEDEFEADEEVHWRATSSSLAGYRSPGPFESDEDLDGVHYHDSVQVGCTLKLVDRAALKCSESESDSEYYDDEDEEYSEEEYWEEDEEFEEEEYIEDEYSEIDEQSMMSAEETSPSPTLFTASIAEEAFDFDETEDTLFEADIEIALPKAIEPLDSTAAKHREITFTKDLELHTAEESTDNLTPEEIEGVKAVAKRIKKDGTTETANKLVVPLMVAPVQESVDLMEAEEVAPEPLEILAPSEVDAETGISDINVVPTFVRPQTEKVQEEFTGRFITAKPSTDFAKKAVIQPVKLEKAKVKETTVADASPNVQVKAPLAPAVSEQRTTEDTKLSRKLSPHSKPSSQLSAPVAQEAASTIKPVVNKAPMTKPVEDKSSFRKSALNMKEEDAKKKAAVDEEVARQKARRLGTVSALADKFKDKPVEEVITYKRSSRLQPKEEEPRPRRKYEIVKPVINDEFDKQMEEIRAQMRAGSSQFQSDVKNLSKGISSITKEAKKRELDDKHRELLDKTSGVFGMAEEEKQRWRDRQVSKEAKPTVEKTKKKAEEKTEEPKAEPKRTIRRINREKKETEKDKEAKETKLLIPSGSLPEVPKIMETLSPASIDQFKRGRTPVVNPADTLKRPTAPKQDIVVDDNNLALFQAVTKVATGRREIAMEAKKQIANTAELEAKIAQKTESKEIKTELKVPKSDGAAATKIRNALTNTTNVAQPSGIKSAEQKKELKRYATRRKTQEIVNDSLQPKRKRRITARSGKFIGNPHDIDVLLGWEKKASFEDMERFFEEESKLQKPIVPPKRRSRRLPATKVWISDLTDIDKIYKASEMRDIAASVEGR